MRLNQFIKATKNNRWRAYARGSVDLCKKHTDFAVNARSNLKEAPRDVKRLECLRNPKDRSMSERYDAAVEKENSEWTSLIAAADAVKASKTSSKGSRDANDSEEEEGEEEDDEDAIADRRNAKKEKQKQKKLKEAPPPPKEDRAVMGMQDDVEEGVDWSSDEE